jgi:hypothetical protein
MKTTYSVGLYPRGSAGDYIPFGTFETLEEAKRTYTENIRGISGFRMARSFYDDERAYELELLKETWDDDGDIENVEPVKQSAMFFVETRL